MNKYKITPAKNDATNKAHRKRSAYVTEKCGSSRFDIGVEIDEDGFEHFYPLRHRHNEAEKSAFKEYDETHPESPYYRGE